MALPDCERRCSWHSHHEMWFWTTHGSHHASCAEYSTPSALALVLLQQQGLPLAAPLLCPALAAQQLGPPPPHPGLPQTQPAGLRLRAAVAAVRAWELPQRLPLRPLPWLPAELQTPAEPACQDNESAGAQNLSEDCTIIGNNCGSSAIAKPQRRQHGQGPECPSKLSSMEQRN